MSDKKESQKMELFSPYYINQGRLLDIYAILNGGYSEYAEITTALSEENKKVGKGEVSVKGNFKIFNFGGAVSANAAKTDSQARENKEKKVQTVTSVLGIVKSALTEKGLICDINEAKPGDFVCLPVVLSINSIQSLLSEMSELLKLAESMQKIGALVKGLKKNENKTDNTLKNIQVLFNGDEILYDTDEYAITGNIFDNNLYQAVRADIIGTELKCLAQVKRVFPNGTELMKNTIFTRLKDHEAKKQMIEIISGIVDANIFDFEAVAVPSIQNKPVYQLEIIALYQ